MSGERAPYRLAHSRFHNSKPLYKHISSLNDTNRIVSVAWNLDEETNILTYGATVYKYTEDSWVKGIHRDKAIERFNTCPMRFQINNYPTPLNRYAMDWYITRYLTIIYGCYYKGYSNNESRIDDTVEINPFTFEKKYDPIGYKEGLEYEKQLLCNEYEKFRISQRNERCISICQVIFSAGTLATIMTYCALNGL